MDISYLGHSSFRLKGKSATLITDPFNPNNVGLKFPKTDGDIVTISHDHDDHNYLDNITSQHIVINGPGEYEVMGVSVIGLSSFHDDKRGELRGKNTIYIIEMDNIRIAHLGDLGHSLKEKDIDAMGDIDILLIPVGGEYTIDSNQAVEVARLIEPRITIPMHFQSDGLNQLVFSKLAKVEPFLAEMGLPVEKEKKLKIKKELLGEDQKIVVLEH